MNRTSIMLPEELKMKAMHVAAARGISLGELIRESLISACNQTQSNARDCFYSDDKVCSTTTASDIAKNHDKYLY